MEPHLKTDLVLAALDMTIVQRLPRESVHRGFPPSCAANFLDVSIQIRQASRVLQVRMPDGRIVEKPLSSVDK
jgi:hypothetical protein